MLERSFAHCYETGNMRRLHLRGRDNIAKRVLVHAAGFSLGLLMRVKYGMPKPRNGPRSARAAVRASIGRMMEVGRSIAVLIGRVARAAPAIRLIQPNPLQLAA